MVLRSLSVFGFKSFADKTTMQFGEGITAVLGPNGCGKSNVVDAIRWVFGEQKASALRSSVMQDVIFSGSQKRQPLNMAEVTLTIENNRKVLPIEYSQVAITRRIYRSGESEYLLNKTPCRLRDIQNLFVDTGIGSTAYTTIENTMIGLILSDKADERRQLFDEASGIGKYKQRRKESRRQLERTTQDLLRINDMVQEAERQVRILGRHVEKARRYKRYYEDLKALEVGFENGRYRSMSKAVAERRNALQEVRTKQELLRGKLGTSENEIEQREMRALEKEEELQQAAGRVSEAGERINVLDREISVGTERLRALEETAVRLTQEMEELGRRIEEKSAFRVQIERSMIDRTSKRDECRARLGGAREELEVFDTRIGAARHEADRLAQEQIESLKQVSESRNELGNLEANLSNCLERADRLAREVQAIESRIAQYTETIETCRRQLVAVGDANERLLQSREVLLGRIETEDARYQQLVEREKKCEAQIDACKSQLKFLAGLDASYEGYESGVKALLTAGLQGLVGTAADCLNVSDEKSIALIERVLGPAVQTVVFDSDRDLESAVDLLQREECGSARMVSLERLNGHSQSRPAAQGAKRLRDAVDCAPDHASLVEYLLGNMQVVGTTSDAMRLARTADRREIFVADDGTASYGDGTVVAGRSSTEEAGILQRKARIEQLRADIERLETEFGAIVHDREVCIINRDEAKYALVEVDEKISTGRREQQEQETTIRHLESEIEVSRARLDEHQGETKQLQAGVAELESRIEGCRERVSQGRQRQDELEQQVGAAKAVVTDLETKRETIAEHLKNVELEVHGLESRINQDRSDIERLGREVAEYGARKQAILGEQHETAKGIEEQTTLIASRKEQLASEIENRSRLEQAVAVVREQYNSMLAGIDELRKQVKVTQNELEQLSNSAHELEMAQTRDEQEMRRIRERIWEAHEVDLESPEGEIPLIDEEETAVVQNIQMLKERIKRVGQVNMASLEDFETESERLKQLTQQRDDLQTAVADLEKAIKKLDREARTQFVATFEQVQRNFAEMFTTLFEGGEASLSLEENVDPLEANIHINARPAGKKMRGVQLLSGGERALTAIALLFGLYLVKPSAYCILDELDAPLDDANIGRFVRILKSFAERTQFIVITHNKRTMEAADLLYGVTQQERGVSQIVSVKLEDALLQAA